MFTQRAGRSFNLVASRDSLANTETRNLKLETFRPMPHRRITRPRHPFTRVAAFVLLLLTLSSPVMATPTDSIEVDLSDHEWDHRLLFVFAPSAAAPSLEKQWALWRGDPGGFAERKLRIYTVVGADQGTRRAVPDGPVEPVRAASAAALRDRFDVAPDSFAVVLVGLDGTEKRRDLTPVPRAAIFSAIDAMPMRRAEMREEDGGGEAG